VYDCTLQNLCALRAFAVIFLTAKAQRAQTQKSKEKGGKRSGFEHKEENTPNRKPPLYPKTT